MSSAAIDVTDLRKSYGDVEAVRGISFEIAAGEIFGLLGPNGAGKTTTVEILEGYRERDAGSVERARRRTRPGPAARGASGSASSSSRPRSTRRSPSREHLALFAGYYERPRDVDEVVELVGLTEKRDAQRANALGRPEAAARPRPRARRRPRVALPRRADDRLRPGGPAPRLGHRSARCARSARRSS